MFAPNLGTTSLRPAASGAVLGVPRNFGALRASLRVDADDTGPVDEVAFRDRPLAVLAPRHEERVPGVVKLFDTRPRQICGSESSVPTSLATVVNNGFRYGIAAGTKSSGENFLIDGGHTYAIKPGGVRELTVRDAQLHSATIHVVTELDKTIGHTNLNTVFTGGTDLDRLLDTLSRVVITGATKPYMFRVAGRFEEITLTDKKSRNTILTDRNATLMVFWDAETKTFTTHALIHGHKDRRYGGVVVDVITAELESLWYGVAEETIKPKPAFFADVLISR